MMQLLIFSCEKRILEQTVLAVCLPGLEGDLQILPGYTPCFQGLKPGMVSYETKDQTKDYLFILDAVAMIDNTSICIIAKRVFQSSHPKSQVEKALMEFRQQFNLTQ
jgi:F0F1-type ATP synthase epsilon subunit